MMKKFLIKSILILLGLMPFILKGQGTVTTAIETTGEYKYYRIEDAFYMQDDSSTVLKNWTDKGMEMLFKSGTDSLVITIDIGGRDKIFFVGMAVKMDNPGFVTTSTEAEFYHWIFVSHIKEGIRNAYILKEYVEGSLEKLGKKHYFINIAFADQTEFQLYGYELQPKTSVSK